MSQDTSRSEVATRTIVYRVPGMDAVPVRRDIPYATLDDETLTMDVYGPPGSNGSSGRMPAVLFVTGYSDVGVERIFGCKAKEMGQYVSWSKLIAASGLAAITYTNRQPADDLRALLQHLRQHAHTYGIDASRIAVWSCSGNAPNALSLLMSREPEIRRTLKAAVLCYPLMLDLDGATHVADAAETYRFVNPSAGKSVADLPPDLPLLLARGGHDDMPHLNETLDRFVVHAHRANRPLTFLNHHTGPHVFDAVDDSDASRAVIQQIVAFLQAHLLC
jgi:hypothetical protein